jgi:hypothetical protein
LSIDRLGLPKGGAMSKKPLLCMMVLVALACLTCPKAIAAEPPEIPGLTRELERVGLKRMTAEDYDARFFYAFLDAKEARLALPVRYAIEETEASRIREYPFWWTRQAKRRMYLRELKAIEWERDERAKEDYRLRLEQQAKTLASKLQNQSGRG